jgi:hypothetical protein
LEEFMNSNRFAFRKTWNLFRNIRYKPDARIGRDARRIASQEQGEQEPEKRFDTHIAKECRNNAFVQTQFLPESCVTSAKIVQFVA